MKWIPNEKFKGSSKRGTIGDVIQETDWQVGKTDRVPAAAGSLFHLKVDVGETTDISKQHPERVAELTTRMKAFQTELKKNTRPIGRIIEALEDVKGKLEKRQR